MTGSSQFCSDIFKQTPPREHSIVQLKCITFLLIMKNDNDNSISYQRAKKEWENAINDTDPNKTNKEYFDEERKKIFSEEFWEKVNKNFSKHQKELITCPECKERVEYGNLANHELRHVLHPTPKVQAKKTFSKILPVIIFLGFLILLVWWLMVRNDTEPNLNVPDDGRQEEVCPNGFPC